MADGPVVVRTPGNAGGAKGPWFGKSAGRRTGRVETGESLLAPELVRRPRRALHAEAKGVAARRAAIAGEPCGRNRPGRLCGWPCGSRLGRGRGDVRSPDERGGTAPHLAGRPGTGIPWAKGMIPDESRDAGNPHVRFDGRGEETWLSERLRHRRVAGAARESGRRTATPSR